MSNILTDGKNIMIINGGNPLEGCPTNWEEAKEWIEAANKGKDEDDPLWSFDCGFKLDFDGPIMSVSSRFYPPKTHSGSTWDGKCSVYVGSTHVDGKKFDCETFEQLTKEVEEYVDGFRKRILSLFE